MTKRNRDLAQQGTGAVTAGNGQDTDDAGRPSRDHDGDHADRDGAAHPQRRRAALQALRF